MKKVFSIIICALFAASAYSQSLRVSFNGSRDFKVIVDNQSYNSGNYLDNDIVLNNLTGQHNVTVYRTNRNGRTKKVYSSTVTLSTGQEVHLTVNNNGSIDREETSANAGYGYRNPINETSFNEIYSNVNNKWGQSSKMSAARDIFNTST